MKKYSKKEVFNIVLYLLIIFFVGIGVTFSYFAIVDGAEKDSTRIYAGKMDVNFIQGQEVSADILFPIEEPSYNTTKNVYRNKFSISTNGTLEQSVSIIFKATLNEFSNNSIRYAVYTENGNKLATGYINEEYNNLAENLYFSDNENREFILLIWLDKNSNELSETERKKLIGTIIIDSKQYGY